MAQDLIRSAYHSDQLNYVSETDYSNYIGWYGGTAEGKTGDNNYLGFWQESYGYGLEGAPAGAKYINKSYGYLGGSAGTDGAADMMHIVVMVHTEIATGHQTVLFKVPSSLIPMVTYKVELEGKVLEAGATGTLTVDENPPIRLLYEVGLPDDVNAVNLEQKVAEYTAKTGNHVHKNTDGSYSFYANSWGSQQGVTENTSIVGMTDAQKQDLTSSVAESHFIPNTANERFYVLEDSIVCQKNGNEYVAVTSKPVEGGTYYFARPVVTVTNKQTGEAKVETQYEILSANTVKNGDNFEQVGNNWVVKEGTIRQTLSGLELEKSDNATKTIAYSDSLWVYVPENTAANYNVYSFLGNNGKLTVAPATGLKVTKNVTELADGADADEAFAITVELSQAEANAVVTDENGDALPAGTWSTDDNKTFVLKLKDGQSAYITGLSANTEYTVTEANNDNYTASYVNGTGTVTANTVLEAEVVNTPIKNGNLYITKEITSDHTIPESILNQEFSITVNVGAALAGKTYGLAGVTGQDSVTVDADGNIALTIKARQTIDILGLPAGTVATITETLNENQKGIFEVSYRSRNHTGANLNADGKTATITAGMNATVVITNEYTPKSTTVKLDIAGTKNFDVTGNQSAQQPGSFTFVVEKWNGQAWEGVAGKTATLEYDANEGSSKKTFTIADVLSGITYDKVGTYSYQVRETIGTVANVTYDRTLYTFTVTVTDNGGQLVAKVTDLNNAEIADGSYEVTFNNAYHTAPVSIDIVKDVENQSGDSTVSKAGFHFVAKEAEVKDGVWSVKEDGSTMTVYSDGQGEARLTATYKEPGSHYFLVSEVAPDPVPNGWTYSNKVYQVEVQVTKDDTTGDLSAALIIDGVNKGDNASISFTNTFDPNDASVDLKTEPVVSKVLTGRAVEAGDFTFAIYENGKADHTGTTTPVATGSNLSAAAGTAAEITFDKALTFDKVGKYEYDVVEVIPKEAVLDQASGKYTFEGVTYDLTIYDLVVEVTLNTETGKLEAVHYFEDAVGNAVFQNTYTAEPTQVVLEGVKALQVNSGLKIMNAGDYTFQLFDNDTQELLQTTTNLANGTFKFDAIEYTSTDVGKTYNYKICEKIPDGAVQNSAGKYVLNGVTYSDEYYIVSVQISDNGDGTLKAEVANSNGASTLKFTNQYNSQPVSVELKGTKTMSGRTLGDKEFQFAIYKTDKTFTERTLVPDQIYNTTDAQDNIIFDFGTLGMGYHYFVVKEVIPEEAQRAAGISYDASEYHITIQVVDNGTGQMSALTSVYHPGKPNETNPAIAFNNIYSPEDGTVTIDGSKIYNGGKALEGSDFEFGLYQVVNGVESTTALQTAKNDKNGAFAFQEISYTAADVGKTYTYVVREIIPAGADDNGDGTKTVTNADGSKVIYDASAFMVEVSIADTEKDGVLEITKTVKKDNAVAALTFTNTFVPKPVT